MVYKLFNEAGDYVDKTTGERKNLCSGNQVFTPDGLNIGWIEYENIYAAMDAFNVEYRPQQELPVMSNKILTKYEFNSKFTLEELVSITETAKFDTLIQVLMNKFNIADEIDLSDSNVIAGLNILVSKGLLTLNRKIEILS